MFPVASSTTKNCVSLTMGGPVGRKRKKVALTRTSHTVSASSTGATDLNRPRSLSSVMHSTDKILGWDGTIRISPSAPPGPTPRIGRAVAVATT
jgi:hypothetical protein